MHGNKKGIKISRSPLEIVCYIKNEKLKENNAVKYATTLFMIYKIEILCILRLPSLYKHWF